MKDAIYRQRYSENELKNRKQCPKCGRWQCYKTFKQLLAARRKNSICHNCANSNRSENTRKKLSKSLKKSWTPERRALASKNIKKRFESYSLVELVEIRGRQSQTQKRNFIKRKKEDPEWYNQWRSNLKKSFQKYKGKNHWMKRPEVHQKVKDSCKIYQNGGHWFHTNPESLRKMIKTKMKKLKRF